MNELIGYTCVQKYAPDCLCSSRLCCRVFLYPFITFQVVSQYFILCLLQFLNTFFCFYCRFICCSDVWLPKLPKVTRQKMQEKVQNYHKKTKQPTNNHTVSGRNTITARRQTSTKVSDSTSRKRHKKEKDTNEIQNYHKTKAWKRQKVQTHKGEEKSVRRA